MHVSMGRRRSQAREREPEALRTFAVRIARRCFLESLLAEDESDHPVLSTEESLVSMARSNLQEHLLATVGFEGLDRARADIERRIRKIARAWIEAHATDGYDVSGAIRRMEDSTFDDLFRVAN